MKVNTKELAGCNKICIHPNGRVSFLFVGKDKNFLEAKSYCEDLNGTLAENLYKRAYQTIQNCCTSMHRFRIGLIHDEVCASNSTHPFRWISQINRCRKGNKLDLGPINNTSTESSICKTVSIATTSSQTEIPEATLDNCNKPRPFICRFKLRTSNSKISITPTKTATSKEETATKPSTTSRIISKAVLPDKRQTVQQTSKEVTATKKSTTSRIISTPVLLGRRRTVKQTRSTGQSLVTFTTARTAPNSSAKIQSYSISIGITLGSVVLIGLLAFFVYRIRKNSDSKRIPTKISSNHGIITPDHPKFCQMIREGDDNSIQSISQIYLNAPLAHYEYVRHDDVNKSREKGGSEKESEYICLEDISYTEKKGKQATNVNSDYANICDDMADKKEENETESGYARMKSISYVKKKGKHAESVSSGYVNVGHDNEADEKKENQKESDYVCVKNLDYGEKMW